MSRPLTIVAIVAAYNEEDVIAEVVRALIAEGVLVYVLNHHSTDGTRARLEPFRGRGVIGIETFPADGASDESRNIYAWEHILRRKEELAQELDADWFVHHDADEFRESPWSGQTLREGIQRVDAADYNAIDFQVLNFLPTSADRSDGDDIRERLLFYEPGRTFDRQQVKCWKKTSHPVVLTASGGHDVDFPGRRVFPIRFLLRHYAIRSQAHGERKVFRERLPRFAPLERARGWHVQYNDLVEGASFVRDPGSLRRYDPEAVRLDLFLRHREVERLEVLAAERERLLSEFTALRRHIKAQNAELDRLRPEREQLLSALEALRRHLEAQNAELDRLRPEREQLLSALEALRRHLEAQDAELDRLRPEREQRLGDFEALRRHLEAQNAELDRLRPEREQRLSDFEALRRHLEAQNAELDRLRPEREQLLSNLEAVRHHLQAQGTELDALRAQLAASEATVAKVLASRSWKLTAPLRAADRLLRGSPESR